MKNTDKLKGKGDLLYLDDDFGISLEYVNGLGFAHCEMNNWSPTIRKRCKSAIDRLQREHKIDAYAASAKADKKHQKFLKAMGFEFFKNKLILDEEGNNLVMSIYWREYYV